MAEPRQYNPEDIESLDDKSRKVLLTIAKQTGHIATNADTDTSTESTGDDVRVATTTSIREATGLGNSKVNYQIRKLGGGYDFSVSEPLTRAVQQGTDKNGRQRPKRVELTDAGEQAIDDGVIEREALRTGPDWFDADASIDEQLTTIATRIEAQETFLDELAAVIGLTEPSTLVDTVENGTVNGTIVTTSDTPVEEYSVIETIGRMSEGQKALMKAIKENGGDPQKHLD